ncbi:probable cytochrome P450 9f2 [Anopheles nili]|uniref:probable cytochrome P450 9f2 n=1 Tax=Anopheles nili TaxID=185578 RepID=UPI00237A62B9|nr:probable cytochrome P450 9f2 [Anopheles nili]
MEINLIWVFMPIVSFLAVVYWYITRNDKYFHDKPIPWLAAEFLFGSSRRLLLKKISFHEFIIDIYNKFPLVKVFGMMETMKPTFVVRDPELIKRIGVRDFEYFMNHRPIFGSSEDRHSTALFGKTLVWLNGQRWRDMREKLSPAFTSCKMRQMFDLIVECSTNMVEFYQSEIRNTKVPQEHEMKDVFTRFAADVIATCAFGIKVDSLRNPYNDFYLNGKKMMMLNRPIVLAKMIGFRVVPKLMSWLNLDLFDREQNAYFTEIMRETVRTREALGIVRPDMVNLLMQARRGGLKQQRETEDREEVKGFATVEEFVVDQSETDKSMPMTEQEMVAQCLLFFLAGFDTVSTCLAFLVFELTINREVQDRLYEEICATSVSLGGSPLTYDVMQGMRYMDMVVSEVLRMWPPASATDRLCVRDYVLNDGDRLKFTIDKGTVVFIPISGLHHDPQYFPNPSKFDPERFSEANREKINPSTYLPFGIGPRNCIGSRFALMEVKSIIYYMLQEFSFERTPNTQVPLRLAKGFSGIRSEKGVFVEFRPRK